MLETYKPLAIIFAYKMELPMKIQCTLEFEYKSEEVAKKVLQAVEIDNYDFVHAEVKNKNIVSVVGANTLPSLLHTLDDYLACVAVAEKVLEGIYPTPSLT